MVSASLLDLSCGPDGTVVLVFLDAWTGRPPSFLNIHSHSSKPKAQFKETSEDDDDDDGFGARKPAATGRKVGLGYDTVPKRRIKSFLDSGRVAPGSNAPGSSNGFGATDEDLRKQQREEFRRLMSGGRKSFNEAAAVSSNHRSPKPQRGRSVFRPTKVEHPINSCSEFGGSDETSDEEMVAKGLVPLKKKKKKKPSSNKNSPESHQHLPSVQEGEDRGYSSISSVAASTQSSTGRRVAVKKKTPILTNARRPFQLASATSSSSQSKKKPPMQLQFESIRR